MSFTILDCEQRSPEWFAARVGRLTGTAAADMMTTIQKGESAARRNLRVRLALECITGVSQEGDFTSTAMQRGIDLEPVALAHYEAMAGDLVERVGFLLCDEIAAGCSLDGFVSGRKGIVETKCPNSATHLEYLKTRKIPRDYYWQCLHNVWVSGAEWCDFVSFDDRFPEELQYLCVRLEPTALELTAYEESARKFLAEVAAEVESIKSLRVAA